MKYTNMKRAVFLSRPNRFIAIVSLEGKEVVCHVKNTGRCRELLIPGATVYISESDDLRRKTKYDLITVEKDGRLINMDSQAPNQVVKEFLPTMFHKEAIFRQEVRFGESRLDHYVESEGRRIYIEVKGVTLEENGVARFPDAPTERGVKHLRELMECMRQGNEAMIFFVIQMSGIRYFEPNDATHAAFGETLRKAQRAGVLVVARECSVGVDSIAMGEPVEVRL